MLFQNQDDFKRFKVQERILIAENQKIALELTEMAKILNLKEKEIKETTEKLKALEIDLNYQKQEI
ncbi:hypothetical protein BKH41_08920 [Helicobacter sp. 12S02232-10]|uniref:hypothetical protein n=1 Tax=Helicobacter sp. 12S02232-10 TaxID=1476197 RepID=UPI000BA76157|nr:hypothetical protein [Helicobacter sp. 12S02232-10]PAF46616.1 hypothetical protein BKH41_08920 [Helicobacter sp. 12S02232-10]